ncbi:MAG TPA: sensor domain-containing diguanylate cyclase [Acidimicrobiales bacterium]|nr:sensor domain-containing diguanylate cyclase [Acidimicrobiales bacterium]
MPEPEVVSVEMARDATSVIISVGDELPDVLGWRPEEFVGHSSTDFVHPEDQLSAIAMWFAMMESPGETHTWQGRYRTSDGEWKWVECVNVSRLEDRDNPVVLTTMKRIAVDQVSVAEELRDRTQLLSRLSDAMPIGMFQMDAKRAITFTNDRLQKILGHSASATVDSQFSIVLDDDRPLLETAFDAVLANESVDDVELRFSRTSEDAPREERVCVLSIRPLTDRSGHVTGAVGCVIDVTAQAELRHQLEIRANTDELTSCPSRARILEVLSGALDDAGDSGTGTAAIFIDLCAFKEINDRLGHAAGDQVLRVAGTRLMSAVRQYDQVGRFGGDEFLIVCPRVESAPTSLEVAKRITAALVQPVKVSENVVDIRASVGVAWSSVTIDADSLIAQADHAMYESKRNGSSSVSLFTETN